MVKKCIFFFLLITNQVGYTDAYNQLLGTQKKVSNERGRGGGIKRGNSKFLANFIFF